MLLSWYFEMVVWYDISYFSVSRSKEKPYLLHESNVERMRLLITETGHFTELRTPNGELKRTTSGRAIY